MSTRYDLYLEKHLKNVEKGFWWMAINIPEIFEELDTDEEGVKNLIQRHDRSKFDGMEYSPYDEYFYGTEGISSYDAVEKNFNIAWLHHIHHNPHHWQHWVLINDDPDKGEIVLDMPSRYVFEMICDWWSFSWKSGDLSIIFDWYEEHKDYMKLSENTRNNVEYILKRIEEVLDDGEDLRAIRDSL